MIVLGALELLSNWIVCNTKVIIIIIIIIIIIRTHVKNDNNKHILI